MSFVSSERAYPQDRGRALQRGWESSDVASQAGRIARDATHLVVSVGSNDGSNNWAPCKIASNHSGCAPPIGEDDPRGVGCFPSGQRRRTGRRK